MAQRFLIVNADDFGRSRGINRGIIEAHERGIVTSASLMVRWPAAEEAAAYARAHPEFGLGLHIDLGEWVYRDAAWVPAYEVVPLDDTAAVADEVARQLERFRELVGCNPTHLDSHQHVHRYEPARSIALALASRLSLPLRHDTPQVRHCGAFYGQDGTGEPLPDNITVQRLQELLAALPPGFNELGCHPGFEDDMDSVYRVERAQEVEVLCDPHVRATLTAHGIALCSFRNVIGAVIE